MAQNETPRNNGKTQLQMFMESISEIKSQRTRKELYAFVHVMRKHNLLKLYLKCYFEHGKDLASLSRLACMINPTVTEIILATTNLKLKPIGMNTLNFRFYVRFKKATENGSLYKDGRNAMHIVTKQSYIRLRNAQDDYWLNPTDWHGLSKMHKNYGDKMTYNI